MSVIKQDGSFEFWYEAELKKGEDGKKWIEGIASTDDQDLQGEKIKQEGLELSYFLQRGYFNDDHAKETSGKVGIPTEARITPKGLWTKGFLLDTPRATGIWELAQGLTKAGTGRKLGFSVEGKVLERDSKNPRIITKAWIKDIAITASPINPNTFLDIAKSFASSNIEDVLVFGDEEAVAKGIAADAAPTKASKDDKPKENEEQAAEKVLEQTEQATKKPVVSQVDEEEKDARKTAKIALDDKKPKQDLEKELNDVPIAKKGAESEPLFTIEFNADGDVVIKSKKSTFKLPKEDPAIVKTEGKEPCAEKQGSEENKTQRENVEKPKHVPENGPTVKKSVETELEKGSKWKVIHSHGGEMERGSKKIPLHSVTYADDKKHHISVSGDGNAFAVLHMLPNEKGTLETIGSRVFYDDPAKGKKAKDDCNEYLNGFGVKHKFLDKNQIVKKALVCAQDSSEQCEVCKSTIQKGFVFMVQDGHSFCDDSCIEKALVTGFAFGKTDQTGGAALRVESLEGNQKDLSYGQIMTDVKVKKVEFDHARANGGQTHVTLRDALDFLINRGIPENMADRILLLMIKNDGDLTKVAEKAKTGGK